MKISEHFSFEELTRTDHRQFLAQNVQEGRQFIAEGTRLCNEVLEPIRALINGPVVVHSGFRCRDLNKVIGGSPTSQHCYMEAADTVYPGMSLESVFNKIAFESAIPFGQIIFEFASWVHVSIQDPVRYPGKVRQILRADMVDGKTVYTAVSAPLRI
jgi:zinc D-Ala-D-Ala carboxypeptidase